jgi:hypothetical protein
MPSTLGKIPISQLWVFRESKAVSAFFAEKDSVGVELEG